MTQQDKLLSDDIKGFLKFRELPTSQRARYNAWLEKAMLLEEQLNIANDLLKKQHEGRFHFD